MCFPGDGSMVAATSDGVAARWDLSSGKKTASYPGNRARTWSERWTWMLGVCGAWFTLWIVAVAREIPPRVTTALIGALAASAGLWLVALHWGAASGPGGPEPISFLTLVAGVAFISGAVLLTLAIKARARLAILTIVLGAPIPMVAAIWMWMRVVASV